MLETVTIERMPRLTFRRLEDLIVRREMPRQFVCYECEAHVLVAVPINGCGLCESCEALAKMGIRR